MDSMRTACLLWKRMAENVVTTCVTTLSSASVAKCTQSAPLRRSVCLHVKNPRSPDLMLTLAGLLLRTLIHLRVPQYSCLDAIGQNKAISHSIAITRDTHTEYIFYCKRAILFLSSSKILTPPSPSLPGECVPPAFVAGGEQTRRAERGMGGQYFGRREKYDCPLTVKYVLCGYT